VTSRVDTDRLAGRSISPRVEPRGLPRVVLTSLLLLAACGEPTTSAPPEPPPPVEVRTSVDPAVATTGDRITYTVELEREPGIAVEVPEPGAEIAGFRILDSQLEPAETLEDGRLLERRLYTLRADLVGSYVLPGITVTYTPPAGAATATPPAAGTPQGDEPAREADDAPPKPAAEADARTGEGFVTLTTSKIFVEVKSVLPQDGTATDIRGLKTLVPPEYPLPPYVWVAAGLVGLVLLAAGILFWRRRRGEVVAPPVPPHELAFAALDALRATDFDDPVAVRRYHFAISEVFRQYVEGRFGLNATDLTTPEILARLGELGGLGNEERILVRSFLLHTDEVKFAGHRPGEDEIRERYAEALQFVQRTIPVASAEADAEPERRAA